MTTKSYNFKIFINIFKIFLFIITIGYLWALHHVVYVDNETKKESFIKNIGNAFMLLLWVIILLLSGEPIKNIIK